MLLSYLFSKTKLPSAELKWRRIARGVNAALHLHRNVGAEQHGSVGVHQRHGQTAERRAHAPHAERIGAEQNEHAAGAERRAALLIRPNDEHKACHRAVEHGKRLRGPQAQKRA